MVHINGKKPSNTKWCRARATLRKYVIDYTAYVPRPLIETGEGGITNSYAYDDRNRAWGKMGVGEEGAIHYYHNDRLGSTVRVTDSAGKIQAKADYDEWGSRTKVKVAQVGGMALDIAASYTDHAWDEALGMCHAKARMYDPGNKRFTAADLIKGDIKKVQSLVSYTYVIDNPLTYIDPDGKYFIMQKTMYSGADTYYFDDYKVAKDNWINQIGKAIYGQVPFFGDFLADQYYWVDAVSSATPLPGQAYYVPIDGTSHSKESILTYLKSEGSDKLIETLVSKADVIAKNIAGDAIKDLYSAIDKGSDLIDFANGLDLVANDDLLFKLIDLGNVSTNFTSVLEAENAMNSLQMLIALFPGYFSTKSLDVSFWGTAETPFCLDYKIFSSDDPEAEIDKMVKGYGNEKYGFWPWNKSKDGGKVEFRDWLNGYSERIELISTLSGEITK